MYDFIFVLFSLIESILISTKLPKVLNIAKKNIIHLNKTAKQLVRKTSYSVNYPWQIAPRTLSSLTTNSLMKISTYFKFEGE